MNREERAIMLEERIPAYARSLEARRAIDLQYKRARNLRRAFLDAGLNMSVNVRANVPLTHKYVSGLNTPSNWSTCVGRAEIRQHCRIMSMAKKLSLIHI